MIHEIIKREWDFFQNVQNIDGRASCQDDFETFYLQRKGQFEVFNDEVRESYLQDLKDAQKIGRNLVMEKYAYMMESTDPEYFQSIQNQLPMIDSKQKELINYICEMEVQMREEFNKLYPHLASNARYTHTQEDKKDDTSFETYLRGELSTYSSHTLWLYGKMILDMLKKDKNMIILIMERTVKAYGYVSLDDAEKKILKINDELVRKR